MTIIARPAPKYADAQVIAIGHNKFGVLWRGELRREQYPTQRLAILAIAALRQASMIPRDHTEAAVRPG
ncbi:MAG TPA: hypothetical protein VE667_13380 [Xanthobacteraceae bacterium]|nr:hypothetical protein [Xanthobacteraceae bacterium]